MELALRDATAAVPIPRGGDTRLGISLRLQRKERQSRRDCGVYRSNAVRPWEKDSLQR
jgi:hypothetical protein